MPSLAERFADVARLVGSPCLLVRPDGEVAEVSSRARGEFGFERGQNPFGSAAGTPDEGSPRFLSAAARSGSTVPGALTTADGQRLRCRGARFSMTPGDEVYILVRIDVDSTLATRFALLDVQFAQLKNEVERRRRAERARLNTERTLTAMLHHTPTHVWLRDGRGRVLVCNQPFADRFGQTADALRGRSASSFMSGPHADQEREQDEQLRAGQTVAPYALVSGAQHLLVAAFAVDGPEETKLFGRVASDVTALKEAEQEKRDLEAKLLHAQKLESLGVLAGGIAHDFNNLLIGVLTNASLCLSDLPSESPLVEPLTDVKRSAEQASELCRQLLAYAGKGRFEQAPLDFNQMVRNIVDLMRVTLPASCRLRVDLDPAVPAVLGDPTQLSQVVMNLVSNGAEALDGGGRVVVRTEHHPEHQHVTLSVEDSGVGMDQATQARIFDPFFSTKFTGRGLGLAAVQGIIAGHGGTLTLKSVVGDGTRFCVTLPARPDLAVADIVRPIARDHLQAAGTVLVVDDEARVRRAARRILERAGYRVLVAADGAEGVELHAQHRDDIVFVLLDMTMPRMSGAEAMAALRAVDPHLPILLSSGHDEVEATSRIMEQGGVTFLHKPYVPATLLEKAADLLSMTKRRSA